MGAGFLALFGARNDKLIRSLQRIWILSGEKGNLRPFLAQFKTFKKIAHELAEAVARQFGGDDGIDELTADRGRFVAQRHRFVLGRIVVFAAEAEQQVPQPLRRVNRFRRLHILLLGMTLHDDQQPVRDSPGVGKIEGDVEMRHRAEV